MGTCIGCNSRENSIGAAGGSLLCEQCLTRANAAEKERQRRVWAHDQLTKDLVAKDATIARLEAEVAELKQKNGELLDHANAVNSDCEQLEAENAGLREECKASRRWKSWRSMMGGPDQSEVREEWDEAIKATDAAGWLKPNEAP